MFCPKCGTKNPDSGKFCRSCGTNLSGVSDAISGKLSKTESKNSKQNKKGKSDWESALSKLFSGIAFILISVGLAFTSMGNGWWFWMLIPGFGALGSGIAQIINIKQNAQSEVSINSEDDTKQIFSQQQQRNVLPPDQTEYVSDFPSSKYETGDLVPPSVVESTTRHLEMNSEGETMTLPKDKAEKI